MPSSCPVVWLFRTVGTPSQSKSVDSETSFCHRCFSLRNKLRILDFRKTSLSQTKNNINLSWNSDTSSSKLMRKPGLGSTVRVGPRFPVSTVALFLPFPTYLESVSPMRLHAPCKTRVRSVNVASYNFRMFEKSCIVIGWQRMKRTLAHIHFGMNRVPKFGFPGSLGSMSGNFPV